MNLKVETDGLENNCKRVVLASSNPHKLTEINAIAKLWNVEFLSVGEGFNPDETGQTFEENAYIKAYEAAKLTNMPSLADDSGLCIDFLNGEPGIYSARYAETPQKRIEKVLENMKEASQSKRTARFVCAMALVSPDGTVLNKTKGMLEGSISDKPVGENGFGYDPIFYLDEYKKTLAEVDEGEKNRISHRACALKPMLDWICKKL